jgi:tetratricopeptide (TPR) repeat protein
VASLTVLSSAPLTWLTCVLVGLVLPASAYAQPRPADRIEEGRAAYESLDYEGAVEALEAALDAPSISPLERAEALEILSFALVVLDRPADAEERLRELFALDPYYDVREPTGSPRIQTFVDAVRRELGSDAALIPQLDVRLTLPRSARADRPVSVRVHLHGEGVDRVVQVVLLHRGETDTDWSRVEAAPSEDGFAADVPPLGRSERLEIYAEARDARGRLLARSAGPLEPTFLDVGSLSESGASSGEDVLTSWWLWTIVGVVVVGAGVGIGVGVAAAPGQAPSGTISPGRVILP